MLPIFNENANLLCKTTSVNKEDYDPLTVLIDYDSPMNKVCHYMEKELSEIKRYSSSTTDSKIIELLRTEKDLQDNNKKDIIRNLCEEYYAEKMRFRKGINKSYNNIDQCAKHLREKTLKHFKNSEEVANYVVEICYLEDNGKNKAFAWNVFGSYLINNLIKNSKGKYKITIPMKDENGDIEYLFNKYSLKEVDLDASDI